MHCPCQENFTVRWLYTEFMIHIVLCIQRAQFRDSVIQFMDHSPHDKGNRNRKVKSPFIVNDFIIISELKDIRTDQINVCRTYAFIILLARMFSKHFLKNFRLVLRFFFSLCEHMLIYMFQGSQNLICLFFLHKITNSVFKCFPAQYRIHDSPILISARKITKTFSWFLRSCFFQSCYKVFCLRAQWFFLCPHTFLFPHQLGQGSKLFPAALIQFYI